MAITATERAQWRTQLRQILKTGRVGDGRRFSDEEIDDLLDPASGATPDLAAVLAAGNAANAKIAALTAGATGTTEAANVTQVEALDAAIAAAAEAYADAAVAALSAAAILRDGSQAWTASQGVGGFGFNDVGFVAQSGTPVPATGVLRLLHGPADPQIVAMASDGVTETSILGWGRGMNDRIQFGASNVAQLRYRAMHHDFQVGSFSVLQLVDEAEHTQSHPAARASFQGTINTGASNQATFAIAEGKQYLVTAWASADDGSGNLLWSECVTGVFCRASGGSAQNGNDDTAVGGVRTTFKELVDMALTLELSTNTLQAKVSNATGTNRNVTIVVTTTERDFP